MCGERRQRAEISAFSFLFLSFPFCSGLTLSFHLSAGMKGSWGGALPSSGLARRQRGYQVLSYSNYSAQSMNKTNKQTHSVITRDKYIHSTFSIR